MMISGLPGAGKSTFCRWLVANHGYVHLDVDHLDECRELLVLLGDQRPGAADQIVRLLRSMGDDVVLDWGFPPHLLPQVHRLGEAGLSLWWFGGDEGAARESFLARGTVSEAALQVQMTSIHYRWEEIAEVFCGRMLDAIRPGLDYANPDELFAVICSAGV